LLQFFAEKSGEGFGVFTDIGIGEVCINLVHCGAVCLAADLHCDLLGDLQVIG